MGLLVIIKDISTSLIQLTHNHAYLYKVSLLLTYVEYKYVAVCFTIFGFNKILNLSLVGMLSKLLCASIIVCKKVILSFTNKKGQRKRKCSSSSIKFKFC